MTKGETAKLLAVLAAAFPRFEVDDLKVQVWHEMIGDLDYGIASLAIKKLILESTFPPSIAEVRKAAVEIQTPEQTNGAQAWGEVIKAIRNYGHYREEEALGSLSPRTAYVVKCMGWREICMAEELGVIRGHFLKMYQQVAEREQKEQLLPPAMRREIKQIAQLRLPESDERDNLQN
jgi:hypothetical protein